MGNFNPSDTWRMLLVDPDGAPYAIGNGGIGMFVPSNTARAVLVDENGIPYKAGGGSGGLSIGTVVVGGIPFSVLAVDGAAKLANSGLLYDEFGNVIVGPGALSTVASNGFFYIPTSPGIPIGIPSFYNGRVPVEYDSVNEDFYIYSNGAWRKVHLTPAATVGGEYFADRYFTPNYWTHNYFN